jgi:cytochrome c oxidase subunit 1
VIIGTEQINIMAHNTLRIPGHFHATVVAGTALAFMAVSYYVVPLIFQKKIAFWKLAKIQPYLFAIGITTVSFSMLFAGTFGVPRRHWDISFASSVFKLEFPPVVDLLMAGVGIGGIVAATGGFLWVLIMVTSVFFGERIEKFEPAMIGVPQGLAKLPAQVHSPEASEKAHKAGAPGTVMLVAVFFVVFVLAYFTNWKALAAIWKIG